MCKCASLVHAAVVLLVYTKHAASQVEVNSTDLFWQPHEQNAPVIINEQSNEAIGETAVRDLQAGSLDNGDVRQLLTHVPGYPCEKPNGKTVHLVIALLSRADYASLSGLRLLGITGATVFTYLRTSPAPACDEESADFRECESRRMEGHEDAMTLGLPCGMKHEERLHLPNIGAEGSSLLLHIVDTYDNPPDMLVLLHSAQMTSWHSQCSVVIRRLRAFCRGLNDVATPVMTTFASHFRTLNSGPKPNPDFNTCCEVMTFGSLPPSVCSWEAVGISPPSGSELCMLKDRKPGSNWTVLAGDVPQWFVDQHNILEKYKNNPELEVPITEDAPIDPINAAPTWSRSRPGGRRQLSNDASGAEKKPEIEEHDTEIDLDVGNMTVKERRLSNTYAMNFPETASLDILQSEGLNYLWKMLVAQLNVFDNYTYSSYEGQPDKPFAQLIGCCLQFAMRGEWVGRASRDFWRDAAFFIGMKGLASPKDSAFVTEFHFAETVDESFMDAKQYQSYVDVDKEMGPRHSYLRCEELEAVRLTLPGI